jgi:hypothetical protein
VESGGFSCGIIFVMKDSSPDLESAFNKVNTCSLCGDTVFMCDCKDDTPDYDDMDDHDEY